MLSIDSATNPPTLSKRSVHTNTAIYHEATIQQLPKASSKSCSSLQFELICHNVIPVTILQSKITLLNKNIQTIKSTLSREKSLYHFSFKIKLLGPSNLNFLSFLLKNSPPITTLTLDVSNLQVATNSSLHSLNLAFKTLKHLSHLNLSFSQAFHLNYNLLSSLKALKSLSHLSLKLSAPQNSNPKWPKYLSQISHLSTLSLALMECNHMTDDDLAFLFSPFSKFTEITAIKIFLNNALNCGAQGLYNFFYSIKDLKKLSKISIDIAKFNLHLQYETIAAGFALINPKLLQDFTLDISETAIKSVDLDVLFAALEKFRSLKVLNLSLARNSRISLKSIEKLALCVAKLRSLTSLELDLAECKIYDDQFDHSLETVGVISWGLPKLDQLLYLRLDFTNLDETSDEDLQRLASSIEKLVLLEKLNLVFNSCREITAHGIKELAGCLGSLKELRVLSLDFSYIWRLKNASMIEIADGISKLSHLKELELNFLFCGDINSDDVKALAEGFESLKELENVNLSFPKLVARGNLDGLDRLFEVFRRLDSLKIITVGVESAFLLSDKFSIPGKEVNLYAL